MKKLILILGKSAAGKDTFAKKLQTFFHKNGYSCHRVISDTTRPPREGEIHGVDYHFVDLYDFLIPNYIEYSYFNNHYYGVPASELDKKVDVYINVVNPQGLDTYDQIKDCDILVIYLDVNFWTRFKRSIKRENKFQFEYLRRAIVDEKDFKDLYKKYSGRYKILQVKNITSKLYAKIKEWLGKIE